jgi:peptidoglycan hydrolase-like protein with peptidoglycan-binding domain
MVTTSRQLEINSIAVHPTHPETVYIGTNNYGVMVSYDSGRTFAPSNGGYSGRFANAIVADREVPNRVYASTINTTTGGGFFFVSEDSGQTWHPAMRNMPARLITYSILQDAQNANLIYLGTNLGVYRSTDRASTWAPVWTPPKTPVKSTKTAPRRRGKVQAAPAKRPLTTARSGVDIVRRAQVALNAAGYSVGAPDGQAGTQTTAAVRRFQSDKNLPLTGALDPVTLAALGVEGANAAAATDSVAMLMDAVNELVASTDADKPVILAATNAGLYKSSDPTRGWQKLPYGPNLDSHTTTVCTVSQQPQTIWVGTATSGVLLSTDSGKSWRQVDGVPTDAPINVIAQDPQQPARVYVGTKQAFFSSHDGGRKWTRRGGNLPFGDFTSIVINPQNSDEVFTGNAYQNGEFGGGVYHSTNAGLTWTRIDPKERRLPSLRIWALALDTLHQNTLFVGSHSAGVYVVPRNAVSASSANSH